MINTIGEFLQNHMFDIVYYCVIIFSVFVIIFQIIRRLKCNTVVKGFVREYDYKYSPDSALKDSYYPIYDYKVGDVVYTKKSRASYSKMKFCIGSYVDLKCNKDFPNQVIMPGDSMRTVLWIFVLIMMIGGKILVKIL